MTTTIETPVSRAETFDADAMLMYGWASDAERNIMYISNSLRRWIRDHRRVAKEANDTLNAIDARGKVKVSEFLTALLDPDAEAATPGFVDSYMETLEALLSDRQTPEGPRDARCGDYDVRLQYRKGTDVASPLLGARFVRDAATLLRSGRNTDRVDIVVVATTERHGDGWRIKGFQGQLQEAWIRVANKITDGNRAGGIALMARNMSHNIGSHALYWVAAGLDEEKKRFLNYLQVRMELLAGFATSMPLSPVPANVSKVVENFGLSKLLLDNICRSEAVTEVAVKYIGRSCQAMFFGGELGIHAFYAILENCIRDSCKFAPRIAQHASSAVLYVQAEEIGDFVQIDVHDGVGNFRDHGQTMVDALNGLKISDESGKLIGKHWGVKERFVCAAMLRGHRPEDFLLMETASSEASSLGTVEPDGLRVLNMVNVNGNCVWRFYLPRRVNEVLLVTDREVISQLSIAVQSKAEFDTAVQSPTGIMMPFVVLDEIPAGYHKIDLEPRLPHRTYVVGHSGDHRFITINDSLDDISTRLLLQRSFEKLSVRPVRLVLAPKDVELGGHLQIADSCPDAPASVIRDNDPNDGAAAFAIDLARVHETFPDDDLVVFKRHNNIAPKTLRENYGKRIVHYEYYETRQWLKAAVLEFQSDPARASYRLLEAALTKILVIDERLDLSLEPLSKHLRREELLLQGICVRGAEFAGHATRPAVVGAEDVQRWAKTFHFVLLHRGVIDKLKKNSAVTPEKIVAGLESGGARVIVHSGRMGMMDMPPQTKFLSLANLMTWIDQRYTKLQIIDEIFALRRV